MDILSAIWICTCIGSVWCFLSQTKKEEIIQSVENMSKGTSIVGVQGSGKTSFAVLQALKLAERGFRWCWITTQGERQCRLVNYMAEYKNDIELWAPYKKDSKGFNFLKCYTSTSNERDIRSQSVQILFENMNESIGDVMKYAIYLSSRIMLEFAHKNKREVTLYDVWQFCKNEEYREYVLVELKDANYSTDIDNIKQDTLDAVSRRFGRLLSSEQMINAICYTKKDALDFQDMFDKFFICDLIEDNINGLGSLQAIAIAQAIVIQFNILASTRRQDSLYYQILCDEFYRYAKGIENIFRDFPDMHRQRRIGLCLIWQRMSQMNDKLVAVALSMVNKYFMQMEQDDVRKLSKNQLYKLYEEKLSKLEPREYIAFLNSGNKTEIEEGKTESLPQENYNIYQYVLSNCRSRIKEKWEWWYCNYHSEDELDTSEYEY